MRVLEVTGTYRRVWFDCVFSIELKSPLTLKVNELCSEASCISEEKPTGRMLGAMADARIEVLKIPERVSSQWYIDSWLTSAQSSPTTSSKHLYLILASSAPISINLQKIAGTHLQVIRTLCFRPISSRTRRLISQSSVSHHIYPRTFSSYREMAEPMRGEKYTVLLYVIIIGMQRVNSSSLAYSHCLFHPAPISSTPISSPITLLNNAITPSCRHPHTVPDESRRLRASCFASHSYLYPACSLGKGSSHPAGRSGILPVSEIDACITECISVYAYGLNHSRSTSRLWQIRSLLLLHYCWHYLQWTALRPGSDIDGSYVNETVRLCALALSMMSSRCMFVFQHRPNPRSTAFHGRTPSIHDSAPNYAVGSRLRQYRPFSVWHCEL